MIEEKVKDILKKYINLEQKKDWKNQKLLGNDLKFSARDLINVYVELEKEFAFLLYHAFMNVLFPVPFLQTVPADSQY